MSDTFMMPTPVDDGFRLRSASTDLISAALRKAQAEMPSAILNAENPHFRNRYADFGSLLAAVKPSLGKHGIAIVMQTDGKWIYLSLELEGKNQFYASRWPALQNANPQPTGSHFTYFRRYLLALMGVVASEEEDDAEIAEGAKPPGGKLKSAAQIKQPTEYPAIEKGIRACESVEDLKRYAYEIGRIIADWRDVDKRNVRAEYDRRMTELEEGVTEEGKPVGSKLLNALKKSVENEDNGKSKEGQK